MELEGRFEERRKLGIASNASDDEGAVFRDPLGTAGGAVSRVEAGKCPRCWRWVCPVHENPNDETDVCDRCLDALSAASTPVI